MKDAVEPDIIFWNGFERPVIRYRKQEESARGV
jgi:hypothetical protein